MNNYLKSAAERFDKKFNKEFLINPISKTDAEIMVEIGQVLKKLGANDVKAILEEYKFKKDTEILDDLLQWNIDHKFVIKKSKDPIKELEEELEEEMKTPPMIRIGDFNMRSYHFHNYDLFEELDEEDEYVYGIILNPVPAVGDMKKVPLYCNERVVFQTEEDRKKVLDNIIQFLSENDVEFIDLNGDE